MEEIPDAGIPGKDPLGKQVFFSGQRPLPLLHSDSLFLQR
jgi:hypothetical protein